jgi:hypothetical protein
MLPEPCLLPDLTVDEIDAVAAEVLAARKGRCAASRDRRPAHDRSLAVGLSPPHDVVLGLRAITVGAHRAHAQVCSGRLADVSAVCDVVGVGVAAEQDGSTWWAQPPVRSGGWVQRGITFEQQSTPTALLGRGAAVGRYPVGVGFDQM